MHGRNKKEDKIDYQAGIVLNKKIGDKVNIDEALACIYTNTEERLIDAKEDLEKAYEINEEKPANYEHILGII